MFVGGTRREEPVSAIRGLWRQSIATATAFLRRYWLLVTRPADYFEKYIRNRKARDLRQTLSHTALLIAAVAGVFGFTFSIFSLYSQVDTSEMFWYQNEYLKLFLTKQYVFFAALLIAT